MTENKQKSKKENKDAQKISELEAKIAEMEENWKRALADYKNLEKRTAEEKAEIINFANVVLIEKLLPILDTLEMLEKHSEDVGVKLTIKELKNVLTGAGLEEINVEVGDPFNHEVMNAVSAENHEENNKKVKKIENKGYTFKGKLIRAVGVSV